VSNFSVNSFKGPYQVTFAPGGAADFLATIANDSFVILDSRVGDLYRAPLKNAIERARGVITIEAIEPNKDARKALDVAEQLMEMGLRRNHQLVAIGGGIIQDITCFLASTLLRGVAWTFLPTTLLAQCDSCIGSKSSINLGKYKNILGTFLPPNQILIDTSFLKTLTRAELCSGVGEMLKVHALAGDESFFSLVEDYHQIFTDDQVLLRRIRKSLEIKKNYIEADEFDRGIRNLLNYGHSFGHAVESATNFAIPHGVAVTIGMDMANFISEKLGLAAEGFFKRAHPTLRANYQDFSSVDLDLNKIIAALAKDKKNTAQALVLILRDQQGSFSKTPVISDARFQSALNDYLTQVWRG